MTVGRKKDLSVLKVIILKGPRQEMHPAMTIEGNSRYIARSLMSNGLELVCYNPHHVISPPPRLH